MKERFWEIVCGAYPAVVVLFVLNLTLLIFLGISFPFVTPGSGSYYVTLLAGAIIAVSLVGLVSVIRVCRSR
jgi:hypothetical protein